MEVSGRPGPAEFHSAPWSKSPDSYNLTWKVDSYPPLQEVRLLYRKLMVNWDTKTFLSELKLICINIFYACLTLDEWNISATCSLAWRLEYFCFTWLCIENLLKSLPLFIVILTPSSRPANEPLTHAMSFTLRGLQSGSVYEAIVQAKNRYGWNEVSVIFIKSSWKNEILKCWNLQFKFIFLTHSPLFFSLIFQPHFRLVIYFNFTHNGTHQIHASRS